MVSLKLISFGAILMFVAASVMVGGQFGHGFAAKQLGLSEPPIEDIPLENYKIINNEKIKSQ